MHALDLYLKTLSLHLHALLQHLHVLYLHLNVLSHHLEHEVDKRCLHLEIEVHARDFPQFDTSLNDELVHIGNQESVSLHTIRVSNKDALNALWINSFLF